MAGRVQIKREVTGLRNLLMICQERIVANNAVCASSPVALQLGWPESAELSGTWPALSEFHYCRHNTLFVVFDSTLSQPADVTGLPAQCPGWGLHNQSTEICSTCVYKTRCEEAQTVIKTEDTLII